MCDLSVPCLLKTKVKFGIKIYDPQISRSNYILNLLIDIYNLFKLIITDNMHAIITVITVTLHHVTAMMWKSKRRKLPLPVWVSARFSSYPAPSWPCVDRTHHSDVPTWTGLFQSWNSTVRPPPGWSLSMEAGALPGFPLWQSITVRNPFPGQGRLSRSTDGYLLSLDRSRHPNRRVFVARIHSSLQHAEHKTKYNYKVDFRDLHMFFDLDNRSLLLTWCIRKTARMNLAPAKQIIQNENCLFRAV